MKYEVYCDESRPDLFASTKPNAKFMVIGSLWLQSHNRNIFKTSIHGFRDKHFVGGEFKWKKVSPSRIKFYKDVVKWFVEQGDSLRFRCIAVDHNQVNLLHYHQNDQELGFYKFYYQMIHHWIMDFNEYSIFCDVKKNRDPTRLQILHQCLKSSNLSSLIERVQAIQSHESVLIQLTDVLTGIAASKLNNKLVAGTAKCELVSFLEEKLGRIIQHTFCAEEKFNVFVMNLAGGW